MHGVLQDYIEAHMWFNLAATQDNEISVRTCYDLAEEMTREHIAEALRRARESFENHR